MAALGSCKEGELTHHLSNDWICWAYKHIYQCQVNREELYTRWKNSYIIIRIKSIAWERTNLIGNETIKREGLKHLLGFYCFWHP